MPYIKSQVRRHAIDMGEVPATFGELNYMFFTKFIKLWHKTTSYDTLHIIEKKIGRNLLLHSLIEWELADIGFYWDIDDICAAAKRAFKEFDRRIANDYENSKIESNGDVQIEEDK